MDGLIQNPDSSHVFSDRRRSGVVGVLYLPLRVVADMDDLPPSDVHVLGTGTSWGMDPAR